jgi:hypothetical protein
VINIVLQLFHFPSSKLLLTPTPPPPSTPHFLLFLHLPLLFPALLPNRRSTSPIPDIAGPADDALDRRRRGVDGRPDVEVEDRVARVRFRVGRVVVDNVPDLFGRVVVGPVARDVPVVSVEGGFGAGIMGKGRGLVEVIERFLEGDLVD